MKNSRKLIGVFGAITILVVACSPSATDIPPTEEPTAVESPTDLPTSEVEIEEPANEVIVLVQDSRFVEKSITVPVGTTVVWRYGANRPHTVTSDDDTFDSGTMGGGDVFTLSFDEPGKYPYYCRFHGGPGGSGMSGTIIVTGE